MINYLDNFRDAYHNSFPYHDENMLMLAWYGNRVIGKIREKDHPIIMSLGIGHKVVCKSIAALHEIIGKYIIIEGSPAIIAELTHDVVLHDNVVIVESFFENFVADGKADVIEMGFVLEHVDDPLFLIRHYANFLKTDGVLLIAVPNAMSLHRCIGKKAGMIDDLFHLSEADRKLGHKRYFDRTTLAGMLVQAGLNVRAMEGIFLKPFSTSQLKSLSLSREVVDALFAVGREYPEISNAIFVEATL